MLQGASTRRILVRHIVPLCLSSVIVRLTLDMAGIILTAAGLGFLGLGAQPPTAEWGAMVSSGRDVILDQWWVSTIPGIAIFLERKREASRQDPAWIERQRSKIEAGIESLARELGGKAYLRGDTITLGDVACACALLWLEFRLPEIAWRPRHAELERWIARLEARPSFAKTRPAA